MPAAAPDEDQTASTAPSPIIMANTCGEWLLAFAFCALVWWFMLAYHDWWRGKPYSLATANEAFALAGVYGLSLSLSLGPLRRLSGGLPRAIRLRRPLGLCAGLCAAIHALLTLLVMNDKYDWAYYSKHWDLLLLGSLALLLLSALCALSWPAALRRVGEERWRRVQAKGYLCLALVLVHFVVLGKFGKWVEWFRLHDQPAPPGTLPAFLVGVAPLVLKAWGMLYRRQAPQDIMGA